MEIITSNSNGKVKIYKSLSTKKGRNIHNLFLIEGYNIVKDLPLDVVKDLIIRESDYNKYSYLEEKFRLNAIVIADNVFNQIAETVNSNGLIAVAERFTSKPLTDNKVIVLDNISDAGNLGVIIRTAAAMGYKDIIAINSADCFNGKTIRASMGGIFHCNIIETSISEGIELLKDYKILTLDFGGKNLYQYNFPSKFAVIVGNEARGISEEIRKIKDDIITIPMTGGKMESLNAGVSMGIVLSYITNKNNTEV